MLQLSGLAAVVSHVRILMRRQIHYDKAIYILYLRDYRLHRCYRGLVLLTMWCRSSVVVFICQMFKQLAVARKNANTLRELRCSLVSLVICASTLLQYKC